MAEEKSVPLSQDAFNRLREELEYLEGEGRQKTIDDIARARAHGDISENAEYHAAKDEQGRQEARIRELRLVLENAEIIKSSVDDGVVKPGKIVTLRYEDGASETFLFGTRAERSEEFDVMSPDSPIGKAVGGRGQGETVTAAAPAGKFKVEIVEVRPH